MQLHIFIEVMVHINLSLEVGIKNIYIYMCVLGTYSVLRSTTNRSVNQAQLSTSFPDAPPKPAFPLLAPLP